MKKVNKIGIRRLAGSTLLQMILEFYKLRLRDLPACCECAKLLEIFVMGTFMIQHLCPPGSTSGVVPRNWSRTVETSSKTAALDNNGAEHSAVTRSCVQRFRSAKARENRPARASFAVFRSVLLILAG